MKYFHSLLIVLALSLTSCGSSVKVLSSWKGEPGTIEKFKQKNVLVIARTADNQARTAFESEIVKGMTERGIKATESYKKVPRLNPQREVSEERAQQVLEMIQSEGFDAIVLTTVKDKQQTTQTTTSGVSVGMGYGAYYPGHYGGFNSYYRYPYAYGPYYSAGGYIPTGSTTTTFTTYVLETVGYNLDEAEEDQLVFVVTSELSDPKDAYKAAEKYVAKISEALGGE
ncbi:hypothetical protein [Robiginitalea marina]|uniref:DUF4136 domain-containing protein n=1 Tax=Robiginitalea marina TaxID=2954105 RepID=A0ABT1B1D6_9FLAO|nr:hypothetical protein [Robiginitalea marina]MCO5725408.1 hypothetical protein [Robiginitalea marina]